MKKYFQIPVPVLVPVFVSVLVLLFVLLLPSLTVAQTWTKAELMGQFIPGTHPDFVLIDKKYTTKDKIYLRSEVMESFIMMAEAARKEGITLTILSATRNFDDQKNIWERKWKLDKYKGWAECDKVADIMKYSSMPGTSRHHWGTDIDINSLENSYFESGIGKKTYDWLLAHGPDYGFYQSYNSKEAGRTGYEEEKWHWSYFPLSSKMLAEYNSTVGYPDLAGFSGSGCAEKSEIISRYVNGVDHPKWRK